MPFVKGQSGNPNGRVAKPLAEDLRQFLAKRLGPTEGTRREALIKALYEVARSGDVAAIKLIFDRIDGAVPQRLAGPSGGPVEFSLVIDHADSDTD